MKIVFYVTDYLNSLDRLPFVDCRRRLNVLATDRLARGRSSLLQRRLEQKVFQLSNEPAIKI